MTAWPLVPLGELLVERKERIGTVEADGLPLLGVSNKEGLHRSGMPRIPDMRRYLRVEKEWFAYNPMRVNVGSIGWAHSEDLAGVISPDYVVFSCTPKIDPRLIYWFLTSEPGLRAINLQTAGSVRERLYFASLARVMMPLPPIEEQRRIVETVKGLSRKIGIATTLATASTVACGVLCERQLAELVELHSDYERPLTEVLSENSLNGLPTRPTPEPPGQSILRISAATTRADFTVNEGESRFLEVTDSEATKYALRPGDLLACRFNGNLAFVGRFALYTGYSGISQVYPDKLIRFRISPTLASPEYVCLVMNSRRVRDRVETMCATTAGNIGIAASDLKAIRVPMPPLDVQGDLVRQFHEFQASVGTLLSTIRLRGAELDSLMPSILNKAFSGQL